MMQETPKSQQAYAVYLGLGPDRTLPLTAQALGRPASYKRVLQEWSAAFKWVERAKLHDAEVQAKELAEKERVRQAAIDLMNDRQVRFALEMHAKTIAYINQMLADADLRGDAAVNLLKFLTDLERTIRIGDTKKIEIAGKDGGPIVIRTSWGTPKNDRSEK